MVLLHGRDNNTQIFNKRGWIRIRKHAVNLILFPTSVLVYCSSLRCNSVFERLTAITRFIAEISYRVQSYHHAVPIYFDEKNFDMAPHFIIYSHCLNSKGYSTWRSHQFCWWVFWITLKDWLCGIWDKKDKYLWYQNIHNYRRCGCQRCSGPS